MDNNGQNPFEIDNIVEIILGYLSIKDLINSRLVNKCCNINATRILCPTTSLSKLRAFKIPHRIEKFEKFLNNSQNQNLFRSLNFKCNGQPVDLIKVKEILQITRPTELILKFDLSNDYESHLKIFPFIIEIVPLICSNIIRLEINEFISNSELRKKSLENFNFSQFSSISFPKLEILHLKSTMPDNYIEAFENYFDKFGDFIEIFTKNSPNLSDVIIPFLGDSKIFPCAIDKLKKLEITTYDDKIRNSEELLKLNNLELESFKTALLPCDGMYLYTERNVELEKCTREFLNLRKFLERQSKCLENLELRIFMAEYFDATIQPGEVGMDEAEKRKIYSLKLPNLEKLRELSIKYETMYHLRVESDIWPLQPIDLNVNCPNLRKISLVYTPEWKENFEILDFEFPCKTLREIVLQDQDHNDMDLYPFTRYFPKVEDCTLLFNCTRTMKSPVTLNGLSGWAETLINMTIDISAEKLEDFYFGEFYKLKKLSSICIRKAIICDSSMIPRPLKPDFSPLFKIRTLSKFSLKYFKIKDHVLIDLYQKFPTFEYK